jgi:predicted nuclease of predicted toxin-antitoxin system
LKLLVDENLPPRLAGELSDLFPESTHVSLIGLGNTADTEIWDYAKDHGFAFLTKDKDFANLSLARGAPPKVILVLIGNCSAAEIVRLIRKNAIRLSELENDQRSSLLILR